MPLLRQSIYSQNVNLYLAPTADGRDTWLPLMRTVAFESRAVVLSCNQCVRQSELPSWVKQTSRPDPLAPQAPPTKEEANSVAVVDAHESAATDGVDGVSDQVSPATKCRRRSIITEDQHEITWPDPNRPGAKHTRHHPPQPAASQSESDPYLSHGGSCIISPLGKVLAGPVWDVSDSNAESLQVVEVDFEDCMRGRLDLDVAGSYSRNDAFKLSVEGLDINPPPV